MKQRFKGSSLTSKKCINSILRFYSLATVGELEEGYAWYKDANHYCRELAIRFNLTLSQAVGIVAVFSPQAGWTENKRYALSFLLNPSHCLRSKVQIEKAKRILTLTSEDAIYHALALGDAAYKTKAFFLNILNPDLPTAATVDRHAIAACIQSPDNTKALNNSYGQLTKKQYLFFQGCYIKAAQQLDILPHELQAITWITYRRLRTLLNPINANDWIPFTTEDLF